MIARGITIHIVAVDDDPAETHLLEDVVRRTGTENSIVCFATAELAWGYLRNPKNPIPQIIIIDVNLPGRSGLDLLRQIKTHDTLRTTPVIILSISSNPQDVAAAYSNHASCYVTKRENADEHFAALLDLVRFWGKTAELPVRRSWQAGA